MNTKKKPPSSSDVVVDFEEELNPGSLRFLESEGVNYVCIEDLYKLADIIQETYPDFKTEAKGMLRILDSLAFPEDEVPLGNNLN